MREAPRSWKSGHLRRAFPGCQGAAGTVGAAFWRPVRLVPGRPAGYMFASFHEARSMRALLDVILIALQIYIYLLIAAAVLSWLIAFNVVNTRNQFVATVGEFLYRITEPALRPIRSIMPNLGGIDISPVILILLIIFLQRVIELYVYPYVV